MWKTKTTTQSTSDLSTKHQTSETSEKKFNIWCHVNTVYQKWQHCYQWSQTSSAGSR